MWPSSFFGKTSIREIDEVVRQLISADMFAICVFDLDTSEREKSEKEKLDKFISCYKDNENVIICTSLPSIEYRFLIHYKDTNKYFNASKEVEKELIKQDRCKIQLHSLNKFFLTKKAI